MKLIDFLLIVIHKFLILLKNLNSKDIRQRTVNTLSFIIFFIAFLLLTVALIYLKYLKLFEVNRLIYFMLCLVLLSLIYLKIKKLYYYRFEEKLLLLEKQYTFSKLKTVLLFICIWFFPIFIFWGVLLLMQHLIATR